MAKLVINYTDGTTKKFNIERIFIQPNSEKNHQMSLCHINPSKEGVVIHTSTDIIPDLDFIKSFDFVRE